MYTFKSNESKKLSLKADFENINPNDIEIVFKIYESETVQHCFKGSINDSKEIYFNIPPLNEILDSDVKSVKGKFEFFKEGYYTSPGDVEIQIEHPPKININESYSETVEDEKVSIKINEVKELKRMTVEERETLSESITLPEFKLPGWMEEEK